MSDSNDNESSQTDLTATQWFIELGDDAADDAAESQFAKWLESDSEHEAEFARCEAAVYLAGQLSSDKDVQWAFAEAARLAARHPHPAAPARRLKWFQNPAVAWSVAGMFAVVAALALVDRDLPQPAMESAATPAPPPKAIELTFTTSQPVVVLPGHVVVDAHSVAVLPFVSGHTGYKEGTATAALAAALHDEVIRQLTAIPGLYVISRGSVAPYEGMDILPEDVAAQLGVRGVVEGNVVSADGRVRVFVRFTDAATDELLLQNAYERPVNEMSAMETEIVTNIAVALANSPRSARQAVSKQ